MKKKILITGGAGFIGTAISKNIVNHNKLFELTIADRLDFGISQELKNLKKYFKLINTDLSILSNIHNQIKKGYFDYIINLASLTHIPTCILFPDLAYKCNTILLLNLLDNMNSKTKLVNFSTSSTYAPENQKHDEKKSKLEPIDFYGWTKKHGEDLTNFYAKRKKLKIINIRLANAAGQGETNTKLLGTIIQQLTSGIIKLGNLTPKRDFIHVDDIAWVITKILSRNIFKNIDNSDYLNLGTGYTPISVKEIYDKIANIYPNKIKLKVSNERKRKIDRELLAPNTTKLFKIFPDFKPKKIDEWLPELVMNPKLRISNKIQKLVDNKYGRFSKKIPSY
jgi:UDP-glucose 4-epimerase